MCKKDFALGVMGVFCDPMKNKTRPTPETDYEEQIDNGDTKPLFVFCRRLERERDEAREELARMQTMAASVADIIAKREAMLEAIREASVLIADCSDRASDATLHMHADNDAKGIVDDVWLWSEEAFAKLKPFLP